MQDDYIRSRGFALTLARKAVADLRRDESRQLRNYVDLCQALAQKTRYNGFFIQAQQVLQQADSLYYTLIRCLLDRVDAERLCTFGVNFGVGGVVYGAAHLKEEIAQTGQPAAWLNTANCASPKLEEAVGRAEQSGKYAWVLYAQDTASLQKAVMVAKRYPFTAFLLVAVPELIGSVPLAWFEECRNLSVWLLLSSPVLDRQVTETSKALCDHKLLFGFAVLLDEQTAEQATNPVWLQKMARWCSFCLYARMPDMEEQTARRLRSSLVRSRSESSMPLLLFDWDGDLRAVNRGISGQAVIGAPVDADLPFPFSRIV